MNDPIDYGSPLGISKREWTKVLGVNLALLLAVYLIALICTLCGSDVFLLNFRSEELQNIETTMREIGIYPLVQMAFSTIESTLLLMYTMKSKSKWWWPIAHLGTYVGLNYLMMATIGHVLSFTAFALHIT